MGRKVPIESGDPPRLYVALLEAWSCVGRWGYFAAEALFSMSGQRLRELHGRVWARLLAGFSIHNILQTSFIVITRKRNPQHSIRTSLISSHPSYQHTKPSNHNPNNNNHNYNDDNDRISDPFVPPKKKSTLITLNTIWATRARQGVYVGVSYANFFLSKWWAAREEMKWNGTQKQAVDH